MITILVPVFIEQFMFVYFNEHLDSARVFHTCAFILLQLRLLLRGRANQRRETGTFLFLFDQRLSRIFYIVVEE